MSLPLIIGLEVHAIPAHLTASFFGSPLVLHDCADVTSEILDVRSQTCFLPVLHLIRPLAFIVLALPGVDFCQQLMHCGNFFGFKALEVPDVDRHTNPAGTWMNNKRALEQVVELLRHLGIKTWICVFETDVLFGINKRRRVEG